MSRIRSWLKCHLVILVAIATVLIVGVAWAQNQQDMKQKAQSQDESYEEKMATIGALRRGGLKEAAKIKKNFVRIFNPHPDLLSFGIGELTKNSEAVIIGVPVKNICELTPDGQLVTTNYDVVVQEVLKGDIYPGSTIKVALVGGKFTFEDGTTAEVQTPNFEKMVNGRTYTLYISKYPLNNSLYILTAGPQGMIELSDDGTNVKSQARETDPVKQQLKNKDVKAFLKEAREMARRFPLPKKCCS